MKKILVFSLFTLLLITFGNTVSAEETVKLVNNNGGSTSIFWTHKS